MFVVSRVMFVTLARSSGAVTNVTGRDGRTDRIRSRQTDRQTASRLMAHFPLPSVFFIGCVISLAVRHGTCLALAWFCRCGRPSCRCRPCRRWLWVLLSLVARPWHLSDMRDVMDVGGTLGKHTKPASRHKRARTLSLGYIRGLYCILSLAVVWYGGARQRHPSLPADPRGVITVTQVIDACVCVCGGPRSC